MQSKTLSACPLFSGTMKFSFCRSLTANAPKVNYSTAAPVPFVKLRDDFYVMKRKKNGDFFEFGKTSDVMMTINTLFNDNQIELPAGNNMSGGGTVYLPPNTYIVDEPIILPPNMMNITIEGAGEGTVIRSPARNRETVVKTEASGTKIIKLNFDQEQSPIPHDSLPDNQNWEPYSYDFIIKSHADDVVIDDIKLGTFFRGIEVTKGRQTISNIRGFPLQTGILLDGPKDVIHMDKLHFWPFGHGGSNYNKLKYARENAESISSFRADGFHMGSMFSIHQKAAIRFGESSMGITARFAIDQLYADGCKHGLLFNNFPTNGTGATQGIISLFNSYGSIRNDAPNPTHYIDTNGISMNGANARVRISNARITDPNTSSVKIAGWGNHLHIDNLWCDLWGNKYRTSTAHGDTISPSIDVKDPPSGKTANVLTSSHTFFTSRSHRPLKERGSKIDIKNEHIIPQP